ncbi:MAG: FAD-binding protein [Deltaproteobacteria bacterium]|nr:FAD-binding protein [Deltaproteobacteria bacterium]
MDWEEQVRQHGIPEWPYPIRYGEETEVAADVLILGGGISGCWAAIGAARKGVNVVMVEKGAAIRSGSGGSGCDHWINTPHPGSPITAEEIVDWEIKFNGGYSNGLSRYIAARESYETLLDLEKMGGKIRDTEDAFRGAPFRDEKTKFLFAYDYKNRIHFRVWGSTFKKALFKECSRLGVRIIDRVMATGLLTEGGATGARVIGATGLHTRTGEFFILRARAVIDCLSRHQRNWTFTTELRGISNFRPTQIVGDGHAMAWRAGAEFTLMERSRATSFASGDVYPTYGHGNAMNTWFPCSMVDARGKEIPYVDREGKVLKHFHERNRPAPGQKFLGERTLHYEHKRPGLIEDLEERVKKGEFVLPFYADLGSMPEEERRAIWGLMVGEEGRTKIPVLRAYTDAGFDPERDMLQSYMLLGSDPMKGSVRPQDRTGGEIGDAGGLVTDWDLKTNLDGLYAAGDALFGGNYHYHAAATGKYAGRKAAEYAIKAPGSAVHRTQVEEEKGRVYEPLRGSGEIEWKELNAAQCRVMKNFCSFYKNEELLKLGLHWLKDLREKEAPRVRADNPHKLMRTLEVLSVFTCSEMIIHASLARRASNRYLDFFRLDYPEVDPPEWNKWITIRQEGGAVRTGERPLDFWAPLAENYEKHRD